jgi:hypothetical protein
MERKLKTEVHKMDENDPLVMAMIALILNAMKGGVRNPTEKVTIIFPSIEVGTSEDNLVETGEWKITLEKVT